jgi:hypothetical protein
MLRSAWVFTAACVLVAAILVIHGPRVGDPIAKAQAFELPNLTAIEPQLEPSLLKPSTPKEVAQPPLADARRLLRWRHVLLVPANCGANGGYDLVLHFHGVAETMEPIFRAAGLDAVVVITNLGLASGPYEKLFTGRASFQTYLAAITSEFRAYCHGTSSRRVALSSWSAGYGATLRILEHEQNRERIDAVLLADGLHGGLERRYPRTVRAAAIEPVNRFAEQAANGQRLLAITHSGIVTAGYASTTETASFLLNSQGIERELVDLPGPRPSMRLRSTAHQAGLWVAGYGGNNADAHCDHLYAFGKTLLPLLEARWNQ